MICLNECFDGRVTDPSCCAQKLMKIFINFGLLAIIICQHNVVESRAVQDEQTQTSGVRKLRITRPVVNTAWNNSFLRRSKNESVSPPQSNYVGKASHIISGILSHRGQFPWQVGMDIDDDFFCGGSLINPMFILTAAHCAHGSKKFDIILGAQNRDAQEGGRQTMTSFKKVVHQKFNSETLQNDIAIVYMPKQAILNNNVKLVNLPPRTQLTFSFLGTKGVVSGWGKTADSDDTVSSQMYYTPLQVLSLDECMQVYGPSSIYRSNLCAAGTTDSATCQGDSGGPLVYKEPDQTYTQIGVVSYGAATGCEMGYPDVFTRVTAYIGWIQTYVPLQTKKSQKSGAQAGPNAGQKAGSNAGQKVGPHAGPKTGGGGGGGAAKNKRTGKIVLKKF